MASLSWQDPSSDAPNDQPFEDLVRGAVQAPFVGWNFDYLHGRVRECDLPWSYEDLARAEISSSCRVLDLNTGGGEVFADLLQGETPIVAVATESWPPNVAVARQRLEPMGIEIRPSQESACLPGSDAEFTLVLNRHGAGDPNEIRRVLAAQGVYLVQRVGRFNDIELNAALGGPPPDARDTATLDHDADELVRAGLRVVECGEVFAEYGFLDVGAVVYHLKAVPWQVPGFDAKGYDDALRRLDRQIRQEEEFVVRHHRYFIKACRD